MWITKRRPAAAPGMLFTALIFTGCSAGDRGPAPLRIQPSGVEPQGIVTEPSVSLEGDPDQPVILGRVDRLSLYADGSGGVGVLDVGAAEDGDPDRPVIVGRTSDAPSDVQEPSDDGGGLQTALTGAKTFDLAVPSMPTGIDGRPWTGRLHLQLEADGTAQASIVQLVTLTGQDTVGAYAAAGGSPWVPMVPAGTFVCIGDADCGLYGLDVSNGPFTCVQNACVEAPQPTPCPPAADQCP